jgi:hypothetical protein
VIYDEIREIHGVIGHEVTYEIWHTIGSWVRWQNHRRTNMSFQNTGRLRWNLDGKHGISLEANAWKSEFMQPRDRAGQFMIGPGWA